MTRKDLISLLEHSTERLAETLTDTLLFCFFTYGASFGKRGSRGIYELFQESESELSRINYKTIKRAFNKLKEEHMLVQRGGVTSLETEITRLGQQRIHALFPMYQENRPWDGHLYLISYDIPTQENWKRNILRRYIIQTGGGLLQESLWVNPYNPQKLLEKFAKQYHVNGTILISKLGTNGAIGTERIEDLLVRIYHLNNLTKRYVQFIDRYKTSHSSDHLSMAFLYHAILKDDPQLPFPLEPPHFPAREAYKMYVSKLNS
jgi:DNA-binding transcriptional regulator PaaX